MNKKQTIISLIVATSIGVLLAFAGSQYSQEINGLPLFAMCAGLAFLINWLAFIPANIGKTEKYYDLVGSLTYICVTMFALALNKDLDPRAMLLAGLVLIWTLRLGSFLYRRIHKAGGSDDRFDKIKVNPLRFFNAWTLQALWVILTAAPAFIAIASVNRKELGIYAIVGLVVWIIGFGIEVIADNQKSKFRSNPVNKEKFIKSGLWSRSRHPNYFGEIVLWIGILIIAFPVLQGWQYIAFISPVFVYLLLTKISGVPMLEAKADKKWGGQKEYEEYKANTPVLVPKLGS